MTAPANETRYRHGLGSVGRNKSRLVVVQSPIDIVPGRPVIRDKINQQYRHLDDLAGNDLDDSSATRPEVSQCQFFNLTVGDNNSCVFFFLHKPIHHLSSTYMTRNPTRLPTRVCMNVCALRYILDHIRTGTSKKNQNATSPS